MALCILDTKPNTAAITKAWLHSRRVQVLNWPACSPDLSHIENIWHIIKHKMQPQTLQQLETYIRQAGPARGIGDIGSCPGHKMTGGCRTKYCFLVCLFVFWSEVRPLVTIANIKDSVNRKLLPTLFHYGDVFPTETEYWIKGGFYFCAPPPFSHSPQTNVWRGGGEIISDS